MRVLTYKRTKRCGGNRQLLCQRGQYLNPRTCVCEPLCPYIRCRPPLVVNYKNCNCECEPLLCGPSVFLNPNTCTCELCVEQNCDGNFVWNSQSCQCECRPLRMICPFGSSWDPVTCQCT
ncbi:CLUMA_CG004439, isoform A [Clunio marinus]|uniref:CLUMA_CG004439, isoform A n=1 Tax=Clunio marinus TaxID=568069 RepID=A0A1J1HRZ2_9DIPT|nr:CLUMA_CG004439, isoform A [Clunio marinus]